MNLAYQRSVLIYVLYQIAHRTNPVVAHNIWYGAQKHQSNITTNYKANLVLFIEILYFIRGQGG